MLALPLLIQQPDPVELLTRLGVQPRMEIAALDGVARLPGGLEVEFIGAAWTDVKAPQPWDHRGAPLDKAASSWFWHTIGEPLADSVDPRSFAVALRERGQMFVHFPMETVTQGSVLMETAKPAQPKQGFPQPVSGFVFDPGVKAGTIDVVVEVEAQDGIDVLTIDPRKPNLPEGYAFKFAVKEVKLVMHSAKEPAKEFGILSYLVTAQLPDALKSYSLELRPDDASPKGLPIPIPLRGQGIDGAEMDPPMPGKTVFLVQAPDRPNHPRKFILAAKPSARVTFAKVPLAPIR